MDCNLYNAASEGNVEVVRQHTAQLEIQTTSNKNTALHVAAQFGQLKCATAILEMCPSLLCRVNIKGETPLHMAAREGYPDIVNVLIGCAKKIEQELESGLGGEAKRMLRVANVDGDTALHMAVRNCYIKENRYIYVVELLTGEDPEFQHPTNNAEETPLYLAAERARDDLVYTLLNTGTSPTYGGPGGRTALHAAALNDSTGRTTKMLLEWKKDLINRQDAYGWTPLHYAACQGSTTGVKELLAVDKSGVYIPTRSKDGLDTALHIAAAHGHEGVIQELLLHNPDCWEVVNSKGQNVLHIAVDMNRDSVINLILRKSWVGQLINQKDNNGNTPLHLLIASDCDADELWKHQTADRKAFNGINMTPIDLVWSNFREERTSTFAAKYILDNTFLDSGIKCGRNIACTAREDLAKLERARTQEKKNRRMKKDAEEQRIQEERKSQIKEKVQKENESVQESRGVLGMLMIVGSLIATISFAANFAIPGGYDGNKGPDQGMAVLARAAAFRGFLMTNTVAMVCSVTSIFLCITAYGYAVRKKQEHMIRRGISVEILMLVSMFAMVLAFIAATFAVLAHSIALAVSVCIIACTAFIVYFFEIVKLCSSDNSND